MKTTRNPLSFSRLQDKTQLAKREAMAKIIFRGGSQEEASVFYFCSNTAPRNFDAFQAQVYRYLEINRFCCIR